MSREITISIVMLVKNEEKNISFCLDAVKSWCNEIIIVDMESNDKTVEIARKYTNKIYSHPQIANFDIARSFADQKASSDWVLMLDADELVPYDLSQKLISLAKSDTIDVVYIPFKTYMLQSWVKMYWWPDYHPRFYRRGALAYPGKVHAYTEILPGKRCIYLPKSEIESIHHFCYRDIAHFIEKLNRYTSVEALNLHTEGKRFSLVRAFGIAMKTFLQYYVRQKGYKEKYHGLFLSLLMSFYRFTSYMKLWEFKTYSNNSELDYSSHKKEIINGYNHRAEK